MLFFKKKFFPIKTTIFVHKENSYYTMNHTVEDLSLFNALRQGDGNSFDHLFRRYYPLLCAYAHRLVSLEDAEEIVQEVMLWLWENRGDFSMRNILCDNLLCHGHDFCYASLVISPKKCGSICGNQSSAF